MKIEVAIAFDPSAQAFLTKLKQDFQQSADKARQALERRLKALEAQDRQLQRAIDDCKRQLRVLTDPNVRQRAIRAGKGL